MPSQKRALPHVNELGRELEAGGSYSLRQECLQPDRAELL